MSREYSPDEARAVLLKTTQLKIKLLERDLQELRKKEVKKKLDSAIDAGGGIEGVAHAKINPPGKEDPMPLRKKPVEKGEPMEDSPHGEEETSGEKSPADVLDDAMAKSDATTKLARPVRPASAGPVGTPKITPAPAKPEGLAAPDKSTAVTDPASRFPPAGAKQKTIISNPTNPSWMKAEKEMSGKCEKCGMEKKDHAMEKRCWEGYEPVPGKEPYSKGSCAPAKKAELTDSKGNHKSNSEHPESAMPDDKDPKHYNKPGKDYTKSKAKAVSTSGSGGIIKENKELEKAATPPMAKPPSGANMATKVPSSKPGSVMKEEKKDLDKGVMSDIARKDSESRTGAPAGAEPEKKVKLPSPAQHADRAAMFGDAMAGAYSAPPAPKLSSPAQAGIATKPMTPTQKPGIFGKLLGKK